MLNLYPKKFFFNFYFEVGIQDCDGELHGAISGVYCPGQIQDITILVMVAFNSEWLTMVKHGGTSMFVAVLSSVL